MPINNIIFDWSGVISDDFDKIYSTYCDLFTEFSRPVMQKQTFRDTFVLPYTEFCREHFPETELETLQESFRMFFKQKTFHTQVFGYSETVLQELSKRRKRMIVLSSHSFVSQEAQRYFPGKNYFERIFEDVKNKTHIIEEVISHMGFCPSETVFVGDMTHDIETGKKAGVKTVAVTSGYHSRKRLEALNPDFLINDIRELINIL